jgi:hypothetical protein
MGLNMVTIQELNKDQFIQHFSIILMNDLNFSEIVKHPEILFKKYNIKIPKKLFKTMTRTELIIYLHQNYINRYIIAYFNTRHREVNPEYVNELIGYIVKTYGSDYNEMRRL